MIPNASSSHIPIGGASPRGGTGHKVRTMVVDDSAVIRGLITRMLEAEDDIVVVKTAQNGDVAVQQMAREDIDVIVLDIEMPVMDGLTALPKLLAQNPNVRVVMASTLTTRNAEISLQALDLGAADYVPKPSSLTGPEGKDDFRFELITKVRELGRAKHRQSPPAGRPAIETPARPGGGAAPAAPVVGKPITLRQPGTAQPQVLAIGSSTGGPQALMKVICGLPKQMGMPILVTQHMPATFTSILANHLGKQSGWSCSEGKDGDVIEPDRIYLAPGDFHMRVESNGAGKRIHLDQGPAENFCRPAVDPMLRSIVDAYGAHVLVAILTGMGKDGLEGCRAVADAGGTVVAQDQSTSVVWGMPGAVAEAGLCSHVSPLAEVADVIGQLAARKR